MAKAMARKTDKRCVLCKHWNGSRGSDTIVPKLGGMYQYEQTEKQKCWAQCKDTQASYVCSKFEPRY